jgi:hypothetical protein
MSPTLFIGTRKEQVLLGVINREFRQLREVLAEVSYAVALLAVNREGGFYHASAAGKAD